jgi:hypothetical protein
MVTNRQIAQLKKVPFSLSIFTLNSQAGNFAHLD